MKGSGLVRPDPSFVLALPIFPGRLQPSIFGAGELNCRVRDGNGWTLTAINTNLLSLAFTKQNQLFYYTALSLAVKINSLKEKW